MGVGWEGASARERNATNMIDQAARERAAELVEAFAAGSASNDELEDGWPRSGDPALREIARELWTTYDDLKECRLDPGDLDRDLIQLYQRIALFLRSSLEYEWPVRVGGPLKESAALVLAVATLGLSRVFHVPARGRFLRAGEFGAWPFIRSSDLEVALARSPDPR